ncbi:NUDIX domain-containing protein [Rhodococcus rhodnii]|nr:NUDIX domain-containing protein [Rhodococcus rhodnii]TXG90575.1 NUDIX domain-containing protein [Rhodococcus rhodnii]
MSAESIHASTVAELEAWQAPDATAEALRHTVLAFLAAAPRGVLREYAPGHVTASAIVVDASMRNVLLTLHPKVGRWIQLGGHCEETDLTVRGAALREAREESGIEGLSISPGVLSLDTHPITCSLGLPTRHLDLQFLVTAPDGAAPVRSHESVDLRWWPVDALPDDAEHETIERLLALAAQRVSRRVRGPAASR